MPLRGHLVYPRAHRVATLSARIRSLPGALLTFASCLGRPLGSLPNRLRHHRRPYAAPDAHADVLQLVHKRAAASQIARPRGISRKELFRRAGRQAEHTLGRVTLVKRLNLDECSMSDRFSYADRRLEQVLDTVQDTSVRLG